MRTVAHERAALQLKSNTADALINAANKRAAAAEARAVAAEKALEQSKWF